MERNEPMASMNLKRAAAIMTVAASVVLTAGAAFASPASPAAADGTTGIAPDPVGKAAHTVRNTEAEADRQVRQLQKTF